MNASSLLSGVLLAAFLLAPSVAMAEEFELLCKGNAWVTGEGRLKIDPANKSVFGRHDEITNGWGTRITINDRLYMAELFDNRDRVFQTEKLDRRTGAYTVTQTDEDKTFSFSAQCEPIDGGRAAPPN